MNKLLTVCFLALLCISCNSTNEPSDDSDEIRIKLIHPTLSMTHNSLLGKSFDVINDEFRATLSVEVVLTASTNRENISRLRIIDNEGLGWNYLKADLDVAFVQSSNSFVFDNLNLQQVNSFFDKVFNVILIDEEEENAFEKGFILENTLPLPALTSNRRISLNSLSIRFDFYDDSYTGGSIPFEIELFDTIDEADTLSIIFLDENDSKLSEIDLDISLMSPASFVNSDGVFNYNFNAALIPEESHYFYTRFRKVNDFTQYELNTQIDTLFRDTPNLINYYDILGSNHIIYYSDPDILIGNREVEEKDLVFIIDKNTKEILHEIEVFSNEIFSHPPVFVDAELELLYYISPDYSFKSFDFNQNISSTIYDLPNPNQEDYFVNLIADQFLIISDSLLIYNPQDNSTHTFGLINQQYSISFNPESYYHFEETGIGILQTGKDDNFNFYKINFESDTQSLIVDELFFTPSNLYFGSNNDNYHLYFSKSDSLLIHTTGAIIDARKLNDFSNSIISQGSIYTSTSEWVDSEKTLFVRTNSETIAAYSLINSGLSLIGTVETKGSPIDLFFEEGKINVFSGFVHERPSFGSFLIEKFSISDFE